MAKILEEKIYGSVTTPKKKIMGEFIEKYVIIALIPWVIYRIGIYIITENASKAMMDEQFSISSISNYYNIANELLLGFLVVIFSSTLVMKKYKLKREDISSVMKAIIVTQIAFLCITTLYYSVTYYDEMTFNYALESKFEWLANKAEKKGATENYNVEKYINDITNSYQTNLVILLAANFSCTILEVILQKKILENNCYWK